MGPQIFSTGIILSLLFLIIIKVVDEVVGNLKFIWKLILVISFVASVLAIPTGILIAIWE